MNNILLFVSQHKDALQTALVLAVMLVLLISCYGQWNDMWYRFGENLYYSFKH